MEDQVILTALGIVATLCGALIWLLKKLFEQNAGTLTNLSSALDRNSKAFDHLEQMLKDQKEESAMIRKEVVEYLTNQGDLITEINQKSDKLIELNYERSDTRPENLY